MLYDLSSVWEYNMFCKREDVRLSRLNFPLTRGGPPTEVAWSDADKCVHHVKVARQTKVLTSEHAARDQIVAASGQSQAMYARQMASPLARKLRYSLKVLNCHRSRRTFSFAI